MREILFKAKREDNGEWVEGYYSKRDLFSYELLKMIKPQAIITTYEAQTPCQFTKHCIQRDYAFVIPETICQYTGLNDKNGNKIFEYDLLRDNKGQVGYVFYREHGFCMNWKMLDGSYETDTCFVGEIIGNIHD